MRTCCLKLQPGGKPGCMEQPWQQLCIWMEASCPGGMTHAQYCYTLSGSWLQLAKPPFIQARVFQLSTPRSTQISPRFFQNFSTTKMELTASLISFPDMMIPQEPPFWIFSPRGFQPNISMFLKNCWWQEGSITGSTPATPVGCVSSLCHLLDTCASSLTSQPQFHLSLKESS